MKATFKFYYNGLKVNGGKLQRAFYSMGNYTPQSGLAADTITIYARDYDGFSKEVWEAFDVKNDTDIQTDYFETDRIRVKSSHPLYSEVLAALNKAKERKTA